MNRGLGSLQVRVRAHLGAWPGWVTLVELRCAVLGSRPSRRGHILLGQPGRWLPAQTDDRTLRRALAGLERRGVVECQRWRPLGWRRVRVRYRLRRGAV